jgi:AcrR family transcriptional regulator
MAKKEIRLRIVEAFLGLLAEHDYEAVSLGMIAERAEVSLAELRAAFDGKLAIVAAFATETDRKVLAGDDPRMGEEPARERLFDVLMRRVDALAPHKEAVRSLARAVRRDPALALAATPIALRAQRWMLAAAHVDVSGLRGEIAVRGAALAFARVVETWLDDEDPGMARTMATLDRELRRGESWMRRLDDAARLTAPLRVLARRLCRAPAARSSPAGPSRA